MNKQAGFSTLLLILILSLMLELMLFSMFLASRVSANRSFSTANSQESYFAAEGILHDSLLLLRKGNWPPELPYKQVVKVGDVSVQRQVSFDQAKQTYHVAVESEFKQAKRKLVAEYTLAKLDQTQKASIDVVLLLDVSDSMKTTINYLKNAVTDMIDSGTFGPDDRIAVVQFNSKAKVVLPFTQDFQSVKDAVRSLNVYSETYTEDGLQKANELIRTTGRKDVLQAVVLFTDGMPTFATDTKGKTFQCSETCFDQSFGNTYAPDNGGNKCTDATIKSAQSLHGSSQVAMYGVFFSRGVPGVCKDIVKNQILGRLTVKQVVGDPTRYFETNQLSNLSGVFQSIGKSISEAKQASVSIQEVAPSEESIQ